MSPEKSGWQRWLHVPRAAGPYMFLLPALGLYALFVLLPVGMALEFSLYHWSGPAATPEWAGLRNFRELAQDAVFWSALWHNLLLIILSLVTQLPLALFLAVLLSYRTVGRSFFRVAFFAPMVMPSVAIAVLWGYVYMPEYGLLDRVIRLVAPTFGYGWLSEPHSSLACVFITICWRYTGFHLVLFMAGMAAIPEELYEAARMDGASEWQLYRNVTLPMLRPMLATAVLFSIIGSLKYFDLIYMMAGGAPEASREVMATYIYRLAFSSGQGRFGYGSAAAVVLFGIALLAAAASNRLAHRREGSPA